MKTRSHGEQSSVEEKQVDTVYGKECRMNSLGMCPWSVCWEHGLIYKSSRLWGGKGRENGKRSKAK